MNLRRNNHFRYAVPHIDQAELVPQAHLPIIGTRTQWKHWKRVVELVRARLQLQAVRGPCPHQLPVGTEKGYSVMAHAHRPMHFEQEPDSHGPEDIEQVAYVAAARF